MIKSDFHVHTSFSTDSDTPAKEQIEALINKGITEIALLTITILATLRWRRLM